MNFQKMYHTIWCKLAVFVIAMGILSIAVFYVSSYAPGDPLQSFYGERVEQMSPAEHEAARQRLGLDGPVYQRYLSWLHHAVQGDFGISFKYKEPALDVIRALIGNTLLLGSISYAIVFILAIGLAVCCALHEDTWIDRAICKIGTIVFYLPAFWVGLVLILLFNVNLGWLPGSGAYDPGQSDNVLNRLEHLVLPMLVMVLSHVWYYAYMIRNKLLDETRQEYVFLAKVKGFSRFYIVCTHCLRNVAPTIVSIMAVSVNHILGGTYVVEAVFSYPGIGRLSIESAKYHDYNLLMLIVLITGALVIASGLIAQAVNERIDGRMKTAEGGASWNRSHRSA